MDSVDPTDNRKVCRADKVGAVTSNASLKFFFNKSAVNDLTKLTPDEQTLADDACYVAFQKPIPIDGLDQNHPVLGRTFEETFIYQNMQLFRDKKITFGADIPDGKVFEVEYETVFNRVKSSSFKKTEFALGVASSKDNWVTPQYIADGLCWLEGKMGTKTKDETV